VSDEITTFTITAETVYDPELSYASSAANLRAMFPRYGPPTRREVIVERLWLALRERAWRLEDWLDTQREKRRIIEPPADGEPFTWTFRPPHDHATDHQP